MKQLCKKLLLSLFVVLNLHLFSQDQPTFEDMSVNKDSLAKILSRYAFKDFYLPARFPAAFIDKQNKVYRIPYEETILAFVDLSAGEECKYGLAFGLKGMYVNNAGLSTSRGPRYISYTVYKNNELRQIIKKELQIEFKAIEIKRLEKEDQATLEKILREIKSKLLQ